ncbi:hypothetical protein SAMN05216233_13031 [Desulfoluna spongiiphila]|uniref:Uncharacterized protein n=1 Tax=Desulfoluna spongiiphila TaxID=419481 RepID=A0A1G5JGA2_9BACT|nr:hypothetical protein SAMN05216233_13031 [Desulfoluna spongiiphila]
MSHGVRRSKAAGFGGTVGACVWVSGCFLQSVCFGFFFFSAMAVPLLHAPLNMERRTPVRLLGRVSLFMPHGVRRSKAAGVRRDSRCLCLGVRWLPSICFHCVWFALCHGCSSVACSIEHGAPHSSAAFGEGVAVHAARSAALQGNGRFIHGRSPSAHVIDLRNEGREHVRPLCPSEACFFPLALGPSYPFVMEITCVTSFSMPMAISAMPGPRM